MLVRVTDPPWQNSNAPAAVTVGVSSGFNCTFTEGEMLEHPLDDVTITLYMPGVVIVIDEVVHSPVVAAIAGTVHPVKYNVVYKVESTIPAH